MPRFKTKGFSLIELLVVVAIIMIILAMAIPRVQAAKQQTLETAAVKAISVIHTAQMQYQSQFGRYASTLAELGAPANLIGPDLASGSKSGYKFRLQATEAGYTINASPVAFNSTGRFTYFSDESLILRQNKGAEPATAASPEVDGR